MTVHVLAITALGPGVRHGSSHPVAPFRVLVLYMSKKTGTSIISLDIVAPARATCCDCDRDYAQRRLHYYCTLPQWNYI